MMRCNNFDCRTKYTKRIGKWKSRRIILSIYLRQKSHILVEKLFSTLQDRPKRGEFIKILVQRNFDIYIHSIPILKNGLSKQQLKLPQIPPSDSPENSYQSLTPSKKSTLLHNKNALPPLLLSRESNSLGVGRGWRGDGGQLHPIPACFRACKYGETCTCSIGEYWAALQSYGGRPRIRSSSARSQFSRACECACVYRVDRDRETCHSKGRWLDRFKIIIILKLIKY